jgi:hypothetical protein
MTLRRELAIALALTATPLSSSRAEVPTPIGEIGSTESARPDPKYEEAIRALRQAMFPPGERVENWDVGGVDLDEAVRARGAEKYYVLETDGGDGSTMLSILTARPIADFAPASWRIAKSYGSEQARLENPVITFGYLSPRYVLAGRANSRRARDAICSDTIGHAVLYEVPDAPRDPAGEQVVEMFEALLLAAEGQTTCERYDGDPEKGYTTRTFLPDGRLILNPDRSVPAPDRVVIVPSGPVDRLIGPPAEPPVRQP